MEPLRETRPETRPGEVGGSRAGRSISMSDQQLEPRTNSSVWSRAPALQASYVGTCFCLTYILFADLLANLANPPELD